MVGEKEGWCEMKSRGKERRNKMKSGRKRKVKDEVGGKRKKVQDEVVGTESEYRMRSGVIVSMAKDFGRK